MPASSFSSDRQSASRELPTSRLSFSSNRFYGRKSELQQLNDAYFRLVNPDFDYKAQMVLIGGYAGTGKSTLVRRSQSVLQQEQQGNKHFFISGKADQQRQDPFRSIAVAFSELSTQLVETLSEEELDQLRQRLLEATGGEGHIVVDIIPELGKVMGTSSATTTTASHNRRNSGHRQKYVFHRFIKALCTQEHPVVLFLDDLQWTDALSLDLLTTLMTDSSLQHFMLIGAYRDNEVDAQHPLTTQLEQIRKKGTTFASLQLGSLSKECIGQLVSEQLKMEPSEVHELTEAIYSKTEGNVFYAVQSLQMLERTGILKYNNGTFRWEWDIARIESEMNMSDNVVDIVVANLERLSDELRNTLLIASFLRSSFEIHVLQELMKSAQDPIDPEAMVQLLDVAVTEGLLENAIGTTKYRFGHDRIQQAAHSLVDGHERDELSVLVGFRLVEMAAADGGEDWMLFMGANYLNSAPRHLIQSSTDPVRLARLNVEVGTRATQVSAFVPAAEYFRLAVDDMEEISERWSLYYDLCLELYTTASEIEFCIGNFDRGHLLAQEVLFNAESAWHKFPARLSLAEGLGSHERHKEALAVQIEAVQLLGEYPKRFHIVHILKLLSETKKAFKQFTDEEILNFPVMTDPTKLMAMNVLSDMAVRAFFCKKIGVALTCTLRGIRMMFEHGLCSASYHLIASYGLMLAGPFGDVDAGRRMGALVSKLADHLACKDHEARSLFVVGAFIEAWNTPLTIVLGTFKRAYQSGMETGDVEFGFMSLACSVLYSYVAGMPLGRTSADLEVLFGQTTQYGVDSIRVMLIPLRRAIMSLTEDKEDPLDWAKSTEKDLDRKCKDPSQTFKWLWEFQMRAQLGYYFKDYKMAERMRDCLEFYLDADPSFATSTFGLYFSGLIATARFRETRKRKYKTRARKATAKMKNLMKTKGINNLHKYYLMEAECSATFGGKRESSETVKQEFDRAISAATKAGFLQDAALAKELAGEYFLRINDTFWAAHYLTESCNAFESWEAMGKVAQLERDHGALINENRSRRRHTAHSESEGRQFVMEMSNKMEQMHNSLDLESIELPGSHSSLPTKSLSSSGNTQMGKSVNVESAGATISGLPSSLRSSLIDSASSTSSRGKMSRRGSRGSLDSSKNSSSSRVNKMKKYGSQRSLNSEVTSIDGLSDDTSSKDTGSIHSDSGGNEVMKRRGSFDVAALATAERRTSSLTECDTSFSLLSISEEKANQGADDSGAGGGAALERESANHGIHQDALVRVPGAVARPVLNTKMTSSLSDNND